MQLTFINKLINGRTLGRFHLIAFTGFGSSGIPMDFCSAGKDGSENSLPAFRHSFSRASKSWSRSFFGFSMEPRGAWSSEAMLPDDGVKLLNAKCEQPRRLNRSTHPPDPATSASPARSRRERNAGPPGAQK